MPLDDSLTLRDEGLSAYHQRHVKQGALGAFLAAIDEGRIPPGSVLVVEGLDRLSRAEPIQAQAQLAQIINAGITVVTASDGREYNREGLKVQPMDLVYSLLVMIRAHEESDTKSKRVKAAVRRQCEGWIAGTWRGVIRNGKDPQWVTWSGKAFELVPDRAAAVLKAIALFRAGYGHQRIADRLREDGQQITAWGVQSQQIYRIIRNRALIGERVLEVGGEEYRLPGYYPPLLSLEEWSDLQALMEERVRQRGKAAHWPSLITGIGVAHCGYCGTAMIAQNMVNRKRQADGAPHAGHRRICCLGHRKADPCPVRASTSVVPIENAIMAYCSDRIRLDSLVTEGSIEKPLRSRLAGHRLRIADLERQLERVTEAMLAGAAEGPTPLAFVRKARELEEGLAREKAAAESTERELQACLRPSDSGTAEAWAALARGVATLDYDARLQARQLIKDTFARIAIYARGVNPQTDGDYVDLVLVAKGGGSRVLRIDRTSGEWVAGEDAKIF